VNKAELINEIAAKAGITKKEAALTLEAFINGVKDALSRGEKVQLVGFGTFSVRERAARSGVNPRTGEKITIPAAKVPVFKPGKELREAVK